MLLGVLLLALARLQCAQLVDGSATQSKLSATLREARYDLRLDGEKFSGSAAPVLARAINEAQYVLIGEEHISREIPAFTTAVCNVMAPRGFSAMAVETSPQVAELVTATLGKPDRLTRMQSLTSQYLDSVAS